MRAGVDAAKIRSLISIASPGAERERAASGLTVARESNPTPAPLSLFSGPPLRWHRSVWPGLVSRKKGVPTLKAVPRCWLHIAAPDQKTREESHPANEPLPPLKLVVLWLERWGTRSLRGMFEL
jgi:hypothetical protein